MFETNLTKGSHQRLIIQWFEQEETNVDVDAEVDVDIDADV